MEDLPSRTNDTGALKTKETGDVPDNDPKKAEQRKNTRVSLRGSESLLAALLRASGAVTSGRGCAVGSRCGDRKSSECGGNKCELELHDDDELRVELRVGYLNDGSCSSKESPTSLKESLYLLTVWRAYNYGHVLMPSSHVGKNIGNCRVWSDKCVVT